MKFQKFESNRICKTFHDDCVIRAISFALNLPYRQVFEELMALGLDIGAYPNHDKVWQSYIENKGWKKNKPPRNKNGKMIKLKDWDDAPKVAIVINSGHLTAVSDGYLVDTWDCTYRPVNSYWTRP